MEITTLDDGFLTRSEQKAACPVVPHTAIPDQHFGITRPGDQVAHGNLRQVAIERHLVPFLVQAFHRGYPARSMRNQVALRKYLGVAPRFEHIEPVLLFVRKENAQTHPRRCAPP